MSPWPLLIVLVGVPALAQSAGTPLPCADRWAERSARLDREREARFAAQKTAKPLSEAAQRKASDDFSKGLKRDRERADALWKMPLAKVLPTATDGELYSWVWGRIRQKEDDGPALTAAERQVLVWNEVWGKVGGKGLRLTLEETSSPMLEASVEAFDLYAPDDMAEVWRCARSILPTPVPRSEARQAFTRAVDQRALERLEQVLWDAIGRADRDRTFATYFRAHPDAFALPDAPSKR